MLDVLGRVQPCDIGRRFYLATDRLPTQVESFGQWKQRVQDRRSEQF